MRGDAYAMGRARRLFEQQSREAYQRNGKKCVCETQMTVIVKTKRRGSKRVVLGAGGTVHLSTCPHSEMARTCWDVDKLLRNTGR